MLNLKISGHSDDIVCVEGDVSDEFYPSDDEPFFIAVSDGTIMRITYDGMWTIRVLVTGMDTKIIHEPATNEDTNYSDIVTLSNEYDLEWVIGGKGLLISSPWSFSNE